MHPVIDNWKNDLYDFSRYNRLTHYKNIKENEYTILNNKLDDVILSLCSGSSFKIDGNFYNYSRLVQKHQNDFFYLAIGLLNLSQKKSKPYAFPIFLYKVDLKKTEDGELQIKSEDNDIYTNPYLRTFLYETFEIVIPEKVVINKALNLKNEIEKIKTAILKCDNIDNITFDINYNFNTVSTFSTRSGFSYADICFNSIDITQTEIVKALLDNTTSVNKDNKQYKFRDEMLEYVSPIHFASTSEIEAMFAILRGQSFALRAPKCRQSEEYKSNLIAELLSENKSVLYLTSSKYSNRKLYALLKIQNLSDNVFTFTKGNRSDNHINRKIQIRAYLAKMLNLWRVKQYKSSDFKTTTFHNIQDQLKELFDFTQKKQMLNDTKSTKNDMYEKLSILFDEYYLCTRAKIHNNNIQNRSLRNINLRKEDIDYIEKLVVDDKFFESVPLRLLLKKYLPLFKRMFPITIMSTDEVNRYIPSNMHYDVVVVDDASMLSILNVFPSLYRAKQVIAIGDDTAYCEENKMSSLKDSQNLIQKYFDKESAFDTLKKHLPLYSLKDTYNSSYITELLNMYFYNNSLTVMPPSLIYSNIPVSFNKVDIQGKNTKNKKYESIKSKFIIVLKDTINKQSEESIGIVTFDDEDKIKTEEFIRDGLQDDDTFKNYCQKHSLTEPIYVRTADTIDGLIRDTIIVVCSNTGRLIFPGGEKLLSSLLSNIKKRLIIVSSQGSDNFNGNNSIGENIFYNILKKANDYKDCSQEVATIDNVKDTRLKEIVSYLNRKDYLLYRDYGHNSDTSFDFAITNKENRHISIGINFDEHSKLTDKSLYEREYAIKQVLGKNNWYYDTIKIDEFNNNRLLAFATLGSIVNDAEIKYKKNVQTQDKIAKDTHPHLRAYTFAPKHHSFDIEHQCALIISLESPISEDWLFLRMYKTYYQNIKIKKAKKYFENLLSRVLSQNTSFYRKYGYVFDGAKKIEFRINKQTDNFRPNEYIANEELEIGIKSMLRMIQKEDVKKKEKSRIVLKDILSVLNISTLEVKSVKKIKKIIKRYVNEN